jgi:hypothetical protein
VTVPSSFRLARCRAVAISFCDLCRWVVHEAHIETLELWTTMNAILWGAWLANPYTDIFAPNRNIFSTMSVLPEWVWGSVAIAGGALQIAGRLKGHPHLIRWGARMLAALWMFGAAAIAMQNWRWLSIITYPMLALASLLVSYRAASYPKRAARRPWEL